MNDTVHGPAAPTRCNLCRSAAISPLYALRDEYGGADEKRERLLHVRRCEKCGVVFISNARDSVEVHEVFWKSVVKDVSAKFEGVSAPVPDEVLRLMEESRKTNNVLDLGCGQGHLLQRLKKKGWHEFGVEVSSDAVRFARSALRLNVVQGKAEDVQFPDDYFDAVVMWGVIEHLDDPRGVLQKVHRILRDGGLLFIYTPNANSFLHKMARLIYLGSGGRISYPLRGLFIPMHRYYFNQATATGILRESGLIPFKIYKEKSSLDMIFAAHADKVWARSGSIRYSIRALCGIASVLRMQHHMGIYAVNRK